MHTLASVSRTLRILLLGLLMVGVLGKPMIVFAGDLHEAEHALSTADIGHAGDGTSDPADAPGTSNPWHALMHYADCCGASAALLPLANPGSMTPLATDPLPHLSVDFQPAAHPVALRPPIRA